VRTRAPGKVNLSLYVGAPREDGYHPIHSVVQAVSLADEVTLETGGDRDEVVCAGIEGPNLALRAVELFRDATGWDGPPVRITIDKLVPLAAGMGGGSADAAAALRLLAHAAGDPGEGVLLDLATRLGADVPSQLRPGRYLMTGIGDVLERLPDVDEHYVIVPPPEQLSTPAVYAEFDRLQKGATPLSAPESATPLFVNDLQPAALSLCPSIAEALDRLREAGAEQALVSGSGPTTFGLFGSASAAQAAAARIPGALAARPVDAGFAAVVE
jgi:4-diphosphocytidyl-2-C-methyl-D-erythritol kinase